jgi:hypothetical protein
MGKIASKRWSEVCTLLFAVLLPVFLGSCGGGSSSEQTWNISGTTYVYHIISGVPGELGPDTFTFTQSGSTLTGTGPQSQAVTGSVNGSDVAFAWVGADSFTYTYTGTIQGGGIMSGTWTATDGHSGTWRSTKTP